MVLEQRSAMPGVFGVNTMTRTQGFNRSSWQIVTVANWRRHHVQSMLCVCQNQLISKGSYAHKNSAHSKLVGVGTSGWLRCCSDPANQPVQWGQFALSTFSETWVKEQCWTCPQQKHPQYSNPNTLNLTPTCQFALYLDIVNNSRFWFILMQCWCVSDAFSQAST